MCTQNTLEVSYSCVPSVHKILTARYEPLHNILSEKSGNLKTMEVDQRLVYLRVPTK